MVFASDTRKPDLAKSSAALAAHGFPFTKWPESFIGLSQTSSWNTWSVDTALLALAAAQAQHCHYRRQRPRIQELDSDSLLLHSSSESVAVCN